MKPSFSNVMLAALKAALLATVTNAILFFIFHAAGIITDDVRLPDNSAMTVVPVAISSLVPSLLAGLVFFLLVRYTQSGLKIFTILAIVLLILSFANPFLGIPGIPVMMGIALNVMHIVVVASLLYFFRKAYNTQTQGA